MRRRTRESSVGAPAIDRMPSRENPPVSLGSMSLLGPAARARTAIVGYRLALLGHATRKMTSARKGAAATMSRSGTPPFFSRRPRRGARSELCLTRKQRCYHGLTAARRRGKSTGAAAKLDRGPRQGCTSVLEAKTAWVQMGRLYVPPRPLPNKSRSRSSSEVSSF